MDKEGFSDIDWNQSALAVDHNDITASIAKLDESASVVVAKQEKKEVMN